MKVVNIATNAGLVSTDRQGRLFNKGYFWAVMDGFTVISLHLTEKAAQKACQRRLKKAER